MSEQTETLLEFTEGVAKELTTLLGSLCVAVVPPEGNEVCFTRITEVSSGLAFDLYCQYFHRTKQCRVTIKSFYPLKLNGKAYYPGKKPGTNDFRAVPQCTVAANRSFISIARAIHRLWPAYIEEYKKADAQKTKADREILFAQHVTESLMKIAGAEKHFHDQLRSPDGAYGDDSWVAKVLKNTGRIDLDLHSLDMETALDVLDFLNKKRRATLNGFPVEKRLWS